jgi:hypothetical protein
MRTTTTPFSDETFRIKDIRLLLSITTIVFVAKAIWAYSFILGPSYFFDELLYRHNAFSIFELKAYFNAHYPPAYPLSLVPGIFFNNWYTAMGVLNAFWSSLLIPASWILGRAVGLRNPIVAAFLVSLIPMHVIYPHYILAENLFVPLFVLAVGIALRGGKSGMFEACIFGIVMGLTHLTKYLFLPSVPLLFLAWYLSHRQVCNKNSQIRSQTKGILFLGVTSYFLVMSIWVIYAHVSGFSFSSMLGLDISGIKSEETDLASLVMWTTAYASYLVLVLYPAWIAVVLWLVRINLAEIKSFCNSPNKLIFILLTTLLLIGYWLLAIQHSFGASYNYPDPIYLIGRYLMHLFPLVIVLSVLCIERLEKFSCHNYTKKAFVGLIFLTIANAVSWWILFRQGVWEFPRWFAKIIFNAVGVGQLDHLSILIALSVMTFVVFAVQSLYPKIVNKMLIIIIALFFFQNTMLNAWQMKDGHAGKHAREMASILPFNQENFIVIDLPWLSKRTYEFGLEFFGISSKSFIVKHYDELLNFDELIADQNQFLIATSIKLDVEPLHTYTLGKKAYQIYNFDKQIISKFRPQIISYGPMGATLGEGFNVQPSGKSAIWMKVSSLSSQAKICWGDVTLNTSRSNGGFISATVPDELISSSYTAKITLYDPFTKMYSMPVDFKISSP